MARSDQLLGLNTWAKDVIWTSGVIREKTERTFFGMFGDTYPLYKYIFPDGRVYHEYVQADPWSGGPVFFIAFKNDKGNWIPRSLWSRWAIDNA